MRLFSSWTDATSFLLRLFPPGVGEGPSSFGGVGPFCAEGEKYERLKVELSGRRAGWGDFDFAVGIYVRGSSGGAY